MRRVGSIERASCVGLLAVASAGCMGEGVVGARSGGGAASVGRSAAAITQVPSGVQCVIVTLTGAVSDDVRQNVTAGAATRVDLGVLEPGDYTVSARAYDVGCDHLEELGTFTWGSDPAALTVRAGFPSDVSLTLRRARPSSATVDFVEEPVRLAAGYNTTFAIQADGVVRGWGGPNYYGLFPENFDTFTPLSPTAVRVPSLRDVAIGGGHACGVTTWGGVTCWGANTSSQLGDPSRPVLPGAQAPTSVTLGAGAGAMATAVAAGGSHACALTAGGAVYCWGDNGYGQLGDNTTTRRAAPTPSRVGEVIAIAAGSSHTCALLSAGGVYCWGDNSAGQLCTGAVGGRELAPAATLLRPVVALAAGANTTCAVLADGTVQCCGDGSQGQRGDGTTTRNRYIPVPVAGLTHATDVTVGTAHACARRDDGSVWCWGANGGGQLGDASVIARSTPVQVRALTDAVEVAAGGAHTCARTAGQTLRCWGSNGGGQLGDGTTTARFTASPVRW